MQFGATPATATILGQVPVIAQDSFAQIFTQSAPSDYPNLLAGGSLPVIDTSKYQSIIIVVDADGLNADFPLNVPNLRVTWFGGATNLFDPTGYDDLSFRTSAGGQGGTKSTRLVLPCRGASMQIFQPAVAGAPNDAFLLCSVFGSYRQIPPRYEKYDTNEWGVSGTGSVAGTGMDNYATWTTANNTTSGTYIERPPFRSGPATYTTELVTTSGGTVVSFLMDDITGAAFAGSRQLTVATVLVQNIILPRRPVRFETIIPNTFNATVRHTLLMQDDA